MPSADFPVACSWALYPLGSPEYMAVIYREITRTLESSDVKASRSHYSSRLDGTARNIFATLRAAHEAVRAHVNHTVIHATLSKGSPSQPGTRIAL